MASCRMKPLKNVWDSISVIQPQFKAAKIDVTATHDNTLNETALKKYRLPIKD